MQKFDDFITDKLNKPAVYLAGIALVILLYLGLFLGPGIKGAFRLFSEVSQLRANIVNTQRQWAQIDKTKEKISQLSKRISYYEVKLPSEKEVPAVLGYLSDSARELNVRLIEIKPVEEEDKKQKGLSYYSVPILLKAESGYHQLGRFLNRLETADRFMKISDIKIAVGHEKANIHKVQLTVITYVMKE